MGCVATDGAEITAEISPSNITAAQTITEIATAPLATRAVFDEDGDESDRVATDRA